VALNQHRPANVQILYKAIDHTAQQAGLFWTVITSVNNQEPSYYSSPDAIRIVQQLQQEQDATQSSEGLRNVKLKHPVGETHHVIRISLEDIKQEMWFGVKRPGFGAELEFVSPWYVFLKQFAEISNAALLRITAAMDLQRYQIEAMRQQGMARSAVNANLLAHDLKTLSGAVLKTISSLHEAVITNSIEIDEYYSRAIAASLNSVRKISEITKVITKETKLDDHQPCSLTRVAEHIERLRSEDFSPDGIRLSVEFDDDYVIDVPYYVVTVAIDNLVTNARNAIVNYNNGSGQSQGRIFISGVRENGSVSCYVRDSGPGIPEALRERIWEYGYSTDPESGGWGLPMIRDRLGEHDCSIELLSEIGGGATFRISFPPAKTSEESGGQEVADERSSG
jgi:signal transduction histidine kinase